MDAWSTTFAPLGTANLNVERPIDGLAVKLVITTWRFSPFAVSTSNCLMLESLSSIQIFALVKLALARWDERHRVGLLPPMVAVPDEVTLKRVRGEFRNCSAGSTVLALLPVYGIFITWPGTLLGR